MNRLKIVSITSSSMQVKTYTDLQELQGLHKLSFQKVSVAQLEFYARFVLLFVSGKPLVA